MGKNDESGCVYTVFGKQLNLNRFSFAYNNPLKYTDPSGHIVSKSLHSVGGLMGGSRLVAPVGTDADWNSYEKELQAIALDLESHVASISDGLMEPDDIIVV